jgi:hypothetical protein
VCLNKLGRGFGGRLGRCLTSKHDLAGLWSNSDSEFSQEINTQNGTRNSSLQKTQSKKFALDWTVFVMNPQDKISNPFAPLRRGPDGLTFDAHGIMLNVATV